MKGGIIQGRGGVIEGGIFKIFVEGLLRDC